MSRSITTAAKNASQASQVTLAVLCELQFGSGPLRMWTGAGDIEWDAKTWSGVGTMGNLSAISETQETRATGVALTLSGIPSSMISLVLGEHYQGRDARLWLAFFSGGAIIDDPVPVFAGRMDDSKIRVDAATGSITINTESHLTDLERARDFRWTDADQQRFFPGDKGLEFIATISEKEVTFGR